MNSECNLKELNECLSVIVITHNIKAIKSNK